MKLIVGLGNPGEKYEKTRHNLGFDVLDVLLQDLTPVKKTTWLEDKRSNSLIAKVSDLILAKPQTFVNASGFAVRKLIDGCQMTSRSCHDLSISEDLWVVHDDLDLPLRKIKIRKGGGSAGHRGIDSIVRQLGTNDFVRFRLGIGHPARKGKWEVGGGKLVSEHVSDKEVERYVLSPFERGEKDEARRMVSQAVEAIKLALKEGLEKAMSGFN